MGDGGNYTRILSNNGIWSYVNLQFLLPGYYLIGILLFSWPRSAHLKLFLTYQK
jgi:hypothetical protein